MSGTACYVKGAQAILDKAIELTGCPVNGTSKDEMFSIDATRCLGACGLAPVAVVDGKVYGNLDKGSKIADIINDIKKEEGIA